MLKYFCLTICFLVSLTCLSHGHTVEGVISNATNMTFSLTKTLIDHGSLSVNPTNILQPYTNTSFELSSPIWNDRIQFTWGYTATVAWCGNVPSQITGTYKYTFGLNSCFGGNVDCPDVGSQSVAIESCDEAVGVSEPAYIILMYYDKVITKEITNN